MCSYKIIGLKRVKKEKQLQISIKYADLKHFCEELSNIFNDLMLLYTLVIRSTVPRIMSKFHYTERVKDRPNSGQSKITINESRFQY